MKTPFRYTLSSLFLLALVACGFGIGVQNGYNDYLSQVRKGEVTSARLFLVSLLGVMKESMPERIRYPLITFNGGFQRMIGRRTVSNSRDLDVVLLSNGHLARQDVWTYTEKFLLTRARQRADDVLRLQSYLQHSGIPFLFVLLPHQIDPDVPDMLPSGIDDCVNPIGDAFVDYLEASGLSVLDIRNSLVDHEKAFFKTDHHLKPEAGLWVYFRLAEHLKDAYGFETPSNILVKANYDFSDLRLNWFLGSSGKRTGSAYAGVDDICYLAPNFDTQLTYEVPARKIRQSGDFPHAIFFKIHSSRDYYRRNSYAVYLNGDYGYSRVINDLGGNGQRLLVLKDSFANIITPHMATVFGQTHIVDLRYLNDETLGEIIERVEPDIVLWMVNVSTLWLNKGFNYEL